MTTGCPSGKVTYRRRRDALIALERIRAGRLRAGYTGNHGLPHHYYRCPACHHWHLTSQQRRTAA